MVWAVLKASSWRRGPGVGALRSDMVSSGSWNECKCLRRAEKGSLRGKEGAGQGAGLPSCGFREPMQMRLMPYPRSTQASGALSAGCRLG